MFHRDNAMMIYYLQIYDNFCKIQSVGDNSVNFCERSIIRAYFHLH